LSDEYFAHLSFSNMLGARSLSRHVSNRQLGLVRIFGMAFFLVLGYARRPARIVRTVRNLLGDRSATVFEQRLLEIKLRALGVVRRAFGRILPHRRVTPWGEALTPP
jgi:hypothetical protein